MRAGLLEGVMVGVYFQISDVQFKIFFSFSSLLSSCFGGWGR